ncbi:MAG: sulfite exporter TauE/SafE family protein [Cyclobacteriaceae bacterium]|nr:sulfite exporter TauE/SafE family protein [Cyclobacteriaceae bacterium]
MEILGYTGAVLIGLVLGMLGGGGSILSIPILVYLFGKDPVLASAYSLFIVGVTSLAGAIPKYRENTVNLRMGLVFGLPSLIGIFVTRNWIVPAIPEVLFSIDEFVMTRRLLLLGLFAVLMVFAAFPMIRGNRFESRNQKLRVFMVVVQGTIIGFLTGLVGAGGGFLIIPALVFLTGLPFKTAVGTSLLIISINSLAGFAGDVFNHPIEWDFLLEITGLSILGILIGNKLAGHVSQVRLRSAFGWMTLVMGIWILIREVLLNN